jgi:hypothetical protein
MQAWRAVQHRQEVWAWIYGQSGAHRRITSGDSWDGACRAVFRRHHCQAARGWFVATAVFNFSPHGIRQLKNNGERQESQFPKMHGHCIKEAHKTVIYLR